MVLALLIDLHVNLLSNVNIEVLVGSGCEIAPPVNRGSPAEFHEQNYKSFPRLVTDSQNFLQPLENQLPDIDQRSRLLNAATYSETPVGCSAAGRNPNQR